MADQDAMKFKFVLAPGESKKLEFPEDVTDALIRVVAITGAADDAKGKPVSLVVEQNMTDYNGDENEEMKTVREPNPVVDFVVGEGEQIDEAVDYACTIEDEPVLKCEGAASLEISGIYLVACEEEEEEEAEAEKEEEK